MARATWIQTNFNGGEMSPLAYGRVDLDVYKKSLMLCRNYAPTQQGGLARRPGTRFVAYAKDSTYAPRLQRFEFSITQAYTLEFGDLYVRFYTNDGRLENPIGTPVEVVTPYTKDDIWQLNFTQSADTLYIFHPNYAPRKLQRTSAYVWTLTTVSFLDGPYLPVNVSSTTLTPSGTTGAVTVTASATAGINNGAGFRASDVGRMLRIKCGGVWLWGTITGYTDTTHVTWTVTDPTGTLVPTTATGTANVSGGSVFGVSITDGGSGYGTKPPSITFGGPGSGAVAYATLTNGVVTSVTMSVTGTGYTIAPLVAFTAPTAIVPSTTTFWRMGLWNDTDGYPTCGTFHQDRLCISGNASYPGRLDCSNSGDYENFAPTNLDGTVVDSNALAFSLNSNTVNAIRWLVSDEQGLLAGTAGGEWGIAPSTAQSALTPTNVSAKQMSNYGSAGAAPVRVGKATMFIQRTGRKLRELFYQFTYNTFNVADISLVSEHLTMYGLKQMAVQLAPQQIIWVARNDGALIGITYDRDQQICGWHRHPLGGFSDVAQTAEPVVESVSSIPAPGIQRDEVWLAVQRYINGATVRTIEVMAKLWEDGDPIPTCCFLDCSAEYNSTPTTTISGLTWLKGQTVGVLADGAVHPDCVVSNTGTITLQRSASVVQVGLKYTSLGKTLPIEAGGTDGPAQGKLKRVFRVVVRFFQSIGLNMGSETEGVTAYPQPWRSSADPMDGPPALFDGNKRWNYESTWDLDGTVYFETSDPLPSNITMLMAQLDTQDLQ